MTTPAAKRAAPTPQQLQDSIEALGADLRKQISSLDRRSVRIETRIVRALTAMGHNPDGHIQTTGKEPK